MDQIKKIAVVPIELEGELYQKKVPAVRPRKNKEQAKEAKVIQVKPKWKIIK